LSLLSYTKHAYKRFAYNSLILVTQSFSTKHLRQIREEKGFYSFTGEVSPGSNPSYMFAACMV